MQMDPGLKDSAERRNLLKGALTVDAGGSAAAPSALNAKGVQVALARFDLEPACVAGRGCGSLGLRFFDVRAAWAIEAAGRLEPNSSGWLSAHEVALAASTAGGATAAGSVMKLDGSGGGVGKG
jgi:hypothetical protein